MNDFEARASVWVFLRRHDGTPNRRLEREATEEHKYLTPGPLDKAASRIKYIEKAAICKLFVSQGI
jgi:hypothetical protein